MSLAKRPALSFGGGSLVFLSAMFYGTYGVWPRYMGDSFGLYAQAWVRSLLVILLLLPFVLGGSHKWQRIQWRRDYKWFLVIAAGTIFISGPSYYVVNNIGVGPSALSIYMGIVMSMFAFGTLFSKERFGIDKWLGSIFAFLGLIIVFGGSLHDVNRVFFGVAFLSGCAAGMVVVAAQKIAYNSSQVTIISWLISIGVNGVGALVAGNKMPPLHDHHWLYLVGFALSSVGASWLLRHGMRSIEAGIAGLIGLMELVWAILLGIVLFNEKLSVHIVLGATCIVIAAALPYVIAMSKNSARKVPG